MQRVNNLNDNLEFFNDKVSIVVAKFKRLTGDWLKISDKLERQSEDLTIQSKLMQEGHDQQIRVISTLVEIELMQQSLDLQDEIDRNQIQLIGLNDTNLSLGEVLKDRSKFSNKDKIAIQLADTCINCGPNNDTH